MSKAATSVSIQDYFADYSQFLDSPGWLMSWQNPLAMTINTFCQATDMTSKALQQMFTTQENALGFFMDQAMPANRAISHQRITTQRVAVVTGGIGGIGTEICKRLYDDGHEVIATYIAMEAELAQAWRSERRSEGYEIDLIECDVTDFDACRKMSRTLERRYNRIDILVNCAGITRDATLRKMQRDQWDAVLDTNLDSVFNVTRNFINSMLKRNYGRIINISSVNGQKGQFGQTNYATAKAGIIGFSKALALEYADSGITVNTVCPGYVGTSMVEAIPDDIKNSIIARIPVGRLAKPAEIASAVAFLAAENSAYITGSEISINGGLFTGVA